MIKKKNINTIQIQNEYELNNITNIDNLIITKSHGSFDLSLIPKSVSSIIFCYTFVNKPSEIPSFVSKVKFYNYSNYLEELHNEINEVEINYGFNLPVEKLGNNFKIIDFGLCFNQSIDNLPSSLEKIVLQKSFTLSINNLPEKIKIIYLHNPNYDYSTIKNLPKNLILLQISLNRDEDIELNINTINNRYFFSNFEDNKKNIYLIQ